MRAKQSQRDGTVFQLLWVVALTWMAVAVTSCGTPSTRMRSTYDQGSLCKSSTHEAGVWPRDHERKLYYNACPCAANALCVMKYIMPYGTPRTVDTQLGTPVLAYDATPTISASASARNPSRGASRILVAISNT